MYTSTTFTSLLALAPLALGSAHYDNSYNNGPKNHDITVGANKELKFVPDRVTAQKGDTLTFTFFPKNHSVTSSSFDKPCKPIGGDIQINSGFVPVPDNSSMTGGPQKFVVIVRDEKTPLWIYCAQTNGNHCQSGMNMVVNEPKDPAKSLDAYRELAKKSGTSEIAPTIGNGVFRPNEKATPSQDGGKKYGYDGQKKGGEWKDGKWIEYKKDEDCDEDDKKKGEGQGSGSYTPPASSAPPASSSSPSYQGGANAYIRARSA